MYQPKKVYAYWGVVDFNVGDPATWWNAIMKFYSSYKSTFETIKDILVQTFAKKALDYITNETIKWIQGGGDPAFVTDFQGFAKGLADDALGETLNKIVGTNLCSNWGPLISISLARIPTFGSKSRCTFSQIGTSYENFMNDFNQGGWRGWIKLTEDANNPYTIYLNALDERTKLASAKQLAGEQKVQSGAGFLGAEVCVEMETCADDVTRQSCIGCDQCLADNDNSFICQDFCDECDTQYFKTGSFEESACMTETGEWKKADIPEGSNCKKWESKTPGTLMADMLGKSVGGNTSWLTGKEKWTSYVAAILDALINRIITEGVLAVTKENSDDASGGSAGFPAPPVLEFDTTPSVTQATTSDAWHVTFIPNEPIMGIFYSVDGSEPQVNVTNTAPYDSSNPITVPILTNTILKWFSLDTNFITEPTRTGQFNPPFSTSPVSTAIGAAGANDIVLLSNKPATIYYSLDGSYPTNRYVKKITISSSGVSNMSNFSNMGGVPNLDGSNVNAFNSAEATGPQIKWLGVDDTGEIESTVHSLVMSPPFPQIAFFRELIKIYDFIAPNAEIVGPVSANQNQFFTLNPLSSSDNDSTPKIVAYEWDFDDDGIYDWHAVDYDRNGVFDELQCKDGNSVCLISNSVSIGNGFYEMQSVSSTPGMAQVKYSAPGTKTIRLMVTDDEGLSGETSVDVNVQ